MRRPVALLTALLASQSALAQTHHFTCDISGVPSSMVVEIEHVQQSGVTLSPGVNPDITGVIGTGQYTLYTAGEIRNPYALYRFSGEGEYADVIEPVTGSRFRIRFELAQDGLYIIPNPFEGGHGYEGSARYRCLPDPK
jgi:hypothetical protein